MNVGPFEVLIALFIVGAVLAGIAQQRYFAALARQTGQVLSNEEAFNRMLDHPGNVTQYSFGESFRRIRALFTKQDDAPLERLRRHALVALALPIVSFVLLLGLPGIYGRG